MPSPYGWNNNYSQGITAAGGSHLIPRDFGDSRQGMGGMANRRGYSGPLRSRGGSIMGSGAFGRDDSPDDYFKEMGKLSAKFFPAPNIKQGYDRSADLSIANAGGQASQASNDFMAQGGAKFGAGGQLMGGALRADLMRPAEATAASLHAEGAARQFEAEQQQKQMLWQMARDWWDRQMQARQFAQSQNNMNQGGSPTSGGGGGGFRVINTPSRWDNQREVDRMAPGQWGDRYWENPEYQAAYEAAGKDA